MKKNVLGIALLSVIFSMHAMEQKSPRFSGPQKELTPALKSRLDALINTAPLRGWDSLLPNFGEILPLLASPDFAGYDISNYKTQANQDTLLGLAVMTKNLKVVAILLEQYNVNPNVGNDGLNQTPLMLACSSTDGFGNIDDSDITMIQLLLRHGARLDVKDRNGFTCFDYAQNFIDNNQLEKVIAVLTTTPPTTSIKNY